LRVAAGGGDDHAALPRERPTVKQYILRRLFYFVPVLFLVTIIAFFINLSLPGDAALAYIGETNIRDRALYESVREELGLNDPIPVQYIRWLGRVARGDFGRSIRTQEPAIEGILARLPVTFHLTLMALFVALCISVPVGIISAVRPNSKSDMAGTLVAIGGVAIPDFYLGILLIYVFGLHLRVLPPSGYVTPTEDLLRSIKSMIMPSVALGMAMAAVIMRQIRSALIEVMQQEYVTVARSKGLSEGVIVRRHALKNALIPVVTIVGLQIGRLFGGAVIIESVFALPGMGRLAAEAILFRDAPMLQGSVLILAVAVLVANLVTDMLYAFLDPRIRYS